MNWQESEYLIQGGAAMEYKLFIDGQWVEAGEPLEVKNKYNQQPVGYIPTARQEDVEAAIAAAARAAVVMADMPAHRRGEILARAAGLIRDRREDLASTIAAEAG